MSAPMSQVSWDFTSSQVYIITLDLLLYVQDNHAKFQMNKYLLNKHKLSQ